MPSAVLHFARTLRAAGLSVGTGSVLDAVQAVVTVGIRRRDDFYWALRASLINGPEQRELFDQAFHLYFRNQRLFESLLALVLPSIQVGREAGAQPGQRRLAEALDRTREATSVSVAPEVDAFFTSSRTEVLQQRDFAQMSREELAQARELLSRVTLLFAETPTRRYRSGRRGGRVDLRATLQRARRSGGHCLSLAYKRRTCRPPPLVLICDISGSMRRYSRVFLHFAHAMSNARERVSTFVFATQLTNISTPLRDQDVDRALEQVASSVPDWSGGTRIADCVKSFNFQWSRRVLGQGALVVLLSDGLEREPTALLGQEMDRLKRSCRRLIWLNPLLRYDAFEARAEGIRAMLPHVDELRSAHNVSALQDLGRVLSTRKGELRRENSCPESLPKPRRATWRPSD